LDNTPVMRSRLPAKKPEGCAMGFKGVKCNSPALWHAKPEPKFCYTTGFRRVKTQTSGR
jgi:hypothetical protein